MYELAAPVIACIADPHCKIPHVAACSAVYVLAKSDVVPVPNESNNILLKFNDLIEENAGSSSASFVATLTDNNACMHASTRATTRNSY